MVSALLSVNPITRRSLKAKEYLIVSLSGAELIILPTAMSDGSYAMLADVVWPSLFLARRLFSWTIIGAGLVIELGFVLWLTRATFARAGLMTLTMNAVSTAVGLIGVPLSGVITVGMAMVSILMRPPQT